jgi:hypothetical protein
MTVFVERLTISAASKVCKPGHDMVVFNLASQLATDTRSMFR